MRQIVVSYAKYGSDHSMLDRITTPPPSEMPATQSILNIGGIFETVLVITEKKSVTFMNEFLLQYVALTSIPAKRFLSNGCEPNVTKYALLPRQ